MSTTSAPAIKVDLIEDDYQARHEALDVTRSFIVKAPAGSGKTELLTRRFLALLGVVENPEEILAITFTRAATAEMRDRVLKALRDEDSLRQSGGAAMNVTARAALEHADSQDWRLLEQPHRLNIQTIDSLCLQIAHEAPLLSRLGGQLQPTEDAQPLYDRAARRTLEQLGHGPTNLTAALQRLLRIRDVNVADCEGLIAGMLARRDQWLADFSSATSHDETDWSALRTLLEEPFQRERTNVLKAVQHYFYKHRTMTEHLLTLAAYACSNEPQHPILNIKDLLSLEQLTHLEHYDCLRQLLLTQKNEWRKRVSRDVGFPTEEQGGSRKHKVAFEGLLKDLSTIDGLLEALCAIDGLPNEHFSDEEWLTVRSIITVLLHGAAQLRLVFRENAVIDFVEAGLNARHALEDTEVQRRWSSRIHHLLIDEFQDTSRRQYELIAKIVGHWELDEHRTCFLVGDPMQSIYLFRQADLALFTEVETHGFRPSPIVFHSLTLGRNFRSDAGIVEPVNRMFAAISRGPLGAASRQHFAPARANDGTPEKNAVSVIVQFDDGAKSAEDTEAQSVVDIIRTHESAILRARATGTEFRVAVLVRAKSHLARIAAALRESGIAYRAVEIETLQERQEIIDLASLVRALLSPLDRIAWLSILRAPWCGLSLQDLHILSGSDDRQLLKRPIPELLTTRIALLSNDGALRAGRLDQTMQLAMSQRFSGEFSASPNGFAVWVERTWINLGGAHCVDQDAYRNVQAFFTLLSSVPPDGSDATTALMTQRLKRFFSEPSGDVTDKAGVQLMTIHKAKGLGFNVVIVPALERLVGRVDSPLIHWMQRTRRNSSAGELLIAPIGTKGDETSATYKWICNQRRKEEDEELSRLLYVASTRARNELHLFGTVAVKHEEQRDGSRSLKLAQPKARTLLATGWPYFEPTFVKEFVGLQSQAAPTGPFLVAPPTPLPGRLSQLAATTGGRGQLLRRLPSAWFHSIDHSLVVDEPARGRAGSRSFLNIPLNTIAQANGTVVHALFEQMASLAPDDPRIHPGQSAEYWLRVATVLLRKAGIAGKELATQARLVLKLLQSAAQDPHGRWILGQQKQARNESAWTTNEAGRLKTMRADRVFIAGSEPLAGGETHLWIVDYKTTRLNNGDSDLFLQQERAAHEGQLAGYGRVLRAALPCELPLRFGLYYPSLPRLDWWEPA